MGYKHRAPYSWCGLLWQCKSHVRQKSASCKWNAKKLSFSYLVIHRKSTFGFPPIKDGLNRNISTREGKLSCSHNYSIRWGTKVYISVFCEVSLGSCLWMCFLRKLRGNFLKRFLATTLIHFQLNRKPLLSVKHNSRVTEAETIINI